MPKVLACVVFNEATQACDQQAWIQQTSIVDVLPTVDQANAVGLAMFLALVGIASLGLLLPDRSYTDVQ